MASPEAIMLEGLLQREWYKPKMSRQEAEDQLKNREVGSFYVRPSTKTDHYALSYKTRDGSISHSLIQITAKGYKVPEEKKVYPTLSDLLKACRFLRWVEPVSDASLAILIEAFPELPQEVIVETLQQTRNNVESSIDILLKKQEHNEIFVTRRELDNIVGIPAAPAQEPKSKSKSKPKPANVTTGMENLSVSPKESTKESSKKSSRSTTVLHKFMKYSNDEFTQKDVFDNWFNLPCKMSTINHIPQSLETNLQKILRNPSHPMGKKIDTFVINFNASYQGTITNKDLESKFQAAIQDVQQFLATLSSNIVGKVTEFNTPAGFIAVWRSSQSVIFPGIYLSLFQLFQRKFFDNDRSKGQAIQGAQHLMPAAFGVKYQGVQYSAIPILQELSNFHGAHDKIATVTRVIQSIHKDVAEHLKRTGARVELNADDLVSILSYVIVQSGLNSVHSELMFMKSFISDRVKSGIDGFGLCAFETALDNMEVAVKHASRPPPQVDLLTNNSPPAQSAQPVPQNFAQPNFAQWPESQPVYNPNQYPNQYPNQNPNQFPNQNPNQFPTQNPNQNPNGYNYTPNQNTYPNQYPPQSYPPQNHPPQQNFPAYSPPTQQSYNPYGANAYAVPQQQPVAQSQPTFNPHVENEMPPEYITYQGGAPSNNTAPQPEQATQASAPPPAFDTLKRVEKTYIQSLKTNATTVDSHNQLAAYYSAKENYLKAIYHSKQALEIDPTNEIAKTNLVVFTKSLTNATAHAKYG